MPDSPCPRDEWEVKRKRLCEPVSKNREAFPWLLVVGMIWLCLWLIGGGLQR